MARITSFANFPFTLALMLALAGCSADRDEPVPADDGPAPATGLAPSAGEVFVRSWQGVLPCSDCAGIQTRLTLRRDDGGEQHFELEETYLGAGPDSVFMVEGSWRQAAQRGDDGPATVFRIDPEGVDHRYRLQPDGSLELLGADGESRPDAIGYRLQRL
ncbi:copper resistance protein NlpE N-terminal domain-containing protein [Arenimonas sp.]|uniref:copper resistance protein NlpE N-terminal domain-containing protein n=1 Tax=Arenimonas sp. TaxID=1872635 RepID=UPI0035AF5395